MDGSTFYNKIKQLRPQYSEGKSALITEILAAKGSRKSDFRRFGPVYQAFMYAFMLGFHSNNRVEIVGKKREFLEMGKWQPPTIVDFILMMIFSDENLINYKWSELEKLNEEELNKIIKYVITIMEEYANGGFSILEDILDNNPEEFQDPFVFINILHSTIGS